MDIRTFRAPTMQQALALVRRELGPEAAVLHTREIRGGALLSWIPGLRQIEVTASTEVNVPSRLPRRNPADEGAAQREMAPGIEWEAKAMFRDELKGRLDDLHSLVEELCKQSRRGGPPDWSQESFRLFTDLIDAEVGEDAARDLVQQVERSAPATVRGDAQIARNWLASQIEREISVQGPIALTPGRARLVALVGPTGVGKTTTIAKLAANSRLRDKRRVGLITVDTYRIAAVEQLRTYADIIDLPMQVVATAGDMRQALRGMADLDLILLDTAGRSPTDDVKLQELTALVEEARPDEVHLTLSSTAGASVLMRTAERFAAVGTTALILTKLDEAAGLGHLLPLLRESGLPLSYVTHGQNVPDDIGPADGGRLARQIVGLMS
ncbi:MAG TPA: flagellar biosynthesis protein FlhF [Pirellulales bacterium]|jgi:flagellar biosynthesis protein FlhF|nr:flagellar biosynthesis protein FlhF [Pirellulales bacterium]